MAQPRGTPPALQMLRGSTFWPFKDNVESCNLKIPMSKNIVICLGDPGIALLTGHVSARCPLLEAGLCWRVYLHPSRLEKQDHVHLWSAVPTGEYMMWSRNSWGGRASPNRGEERVKGAALAQEPVTKLCSCCGC